MKYGLNLRVQSSQQKKKPTKPPLPSTLGFNDDDEDDIEREISRQASKNKALKDIEEQHKKALEEDPSVFDYDGVYDEMKEKVVRPVAQDRQERKPRYIQKLIEKAKVREQEHEIVYERKLAKERSKEDHLFAGKDKFVTAAYKKKLAEQAKWLEEDRLRQLREEKEDITKKGDMTEFYFNLSKNVAFGATETESKKPGHPTDKSTIPISEERPSAQADSSTPTERNQRESSIVPEEEAKSMDSKSKPLFDSNKQEESKDSQKPGAAGQTKTETDHHKRNQDALAAAKERFLARKKTKVNVD